MSFPDLTSHFIYPNGVQSEVFYKEEVRVWAKALAEKLKPRDGACLEFHDSKEDSVEKFQTCKDIYARESGYCPSCLVYYELMRVGEK